MRGKIEQWLPESSIAAHVQLSGPSDVIQPEQWSAYTEQLFSQMRWMCRMAIKRPSEGLLETIADTLKPIPRHPVESLVKGALSDFDLPDHKGFLLPRVAMKSSDPPLEGFSITVQNSGRPDAFIFGVYINPAHPVVRPLRNYSVLPGRKVIQSFLTELAQVESEFLIAVGNNTLPVLTRAESVVALKL